MDADIGYGCRDQPGIFCTAALDRADCPRPAGVSKHGPERYPFKYAREVQPRPALARWQTEPNQQCMNAAIAISTILPGQR